MDPQFIFLIEHISICAGMHYADSMLLISMARIISTFDIRPAKDENGKDIIPPLKFNSSIVR